MAKTQRTNHKNRRGYFDIDIDECDFIENRGTIDDIFYWRDLQQRKLFINDDISSVSVFDIVKCIMQYNTEDKGLQYDEREPIYLYICSNGGDLDAGFELIDVVQKSKTPVYTINLGYQYSMGFLIGLAGHKRFATPHAKFLMHDGSSYVYDSTAKVQDRMAFQSKVEQRVKAYILANSKLTEEEYDSKLRVEWYMFADEAKEKGFCDYILGEDCPIDDII